MTGTTMTMTTTRLPVCFTLGAAITVALFWFMWTMISGPVTIITAPKIPKVDFTRLIRDSGPEKTDIQKPERPTVTDVPPTRFDVTDAGPGEGPRIIIDAPDPPIDQTPSGPQPRLDGEATPLVQPPPEYPVRAVTGSVEGWVMVEFTVTSSGAVANARVVDAEPQGVFDDAALKAIARWKYNPRVVDGAAVERRGMRVVIRFDLED